MKTNRMAFLGVLLVLALASASGLFAQETEAEDQRTDNR
jgi:hypothetical protein